MAEEQARESRESGAGQRQGGRRDNSRRIVLQILRSCRGKGTYSHVAVKRALDEHDDLSRQQKAFIKRLAEGVLERAIELDELIRRYSRNGEPEDDVRDVLRIGLYQILYMDAVPDRAAVNETAALAKSLHQGRGITGYVNGLLRSVIRDRESGRFRQKTRGETLAQKSSMPQWIVDMWTGIYGEERTKSLLDAFLQIRPVVIRFDARLSAEEIEACCALLTEAGVQVQPGRWFDRARVISATSNLAALPGFAEGLWSVQDESGMFVAQAAGISGGETIIDPCAAPGGKTMDAASRLLAIAAREGKDPGQVYSYDIGGKKIERIRENCRRMNLTNVTAQERDARTAVPADQAGTADIVLLDVPCSGLGVMGRKRDIKYRASLSKIQSLTMLQKQIVRRAVKYLKKGGVLIYSTCTICRAENEHMAQYIERELGLRPDSLAPYLPEGVRGDLGGRYHNCLQLLPDVHGTDGFFVARFVKP